MISLGIFKNEGPVSHSTMNNSVTKNRRTLFYVYSREPDRKYFEQSVWPFAFFIMWDELTAGLFQVLQARRTDSNMRPAFSVMLSISGYDFLKYNFPYNIISFCSNEFSLHSRTLKSYGISFSSKISFNICIDLVARSFADFDLPIVPLCLNKVQSEAENLLSSSFSLRGFLIVELSW